MNIELLKAKMDKFFAEVSPEYLVSEFEKMGYSFTFAEVDVKWNSPEAYQISETNYQQEENCLQRLLERDSQENAENILTSDYPGSFFCAKIAA